MGRSRAGAIVGMLLVVAMAVTACELADPKPTELLCSGPTSTITGSSNPGRACTTSDADSSDALAATYPSTPMTCDYHDPVTLADRSMSLDVYRSTASLTSATPANVIVYFHGGGWFDGAKSDLDLTGGYVTRGGGAIKAQLARGWVVVSADYRLSDQAAFPAQAIDARAAVNCAKGLDNVNGSHVVVSGSSAGGHLATLITLAAARPTPDPIPEPTLSTPTTPPPGHLQGGTTTRTTVHAAVSLDGPTNLDSLDTTPLPTTRTWPASFGTNKVFKDLAGQLLCGPTDAGDETNPCPNFGADHDAASPITYVASLPNTGGALPPRIYLACGTTPGFPPGFQHCADHHAFLDAMRTRFPCTSTTTPCDINNSTYTNSGDAYTWLDDTTDNNQYVSDSTTTSMLLPDLHGNHLNLDVALNLAQLDTFIDG